MIVALIRIVLLLHICVEMELVEQEPDFMALSRQFKATAMELISVLEQVIVVHSIFSLD